MRLLGSVLLAVCCVLWGLDRERALKAHVHRLETAELFWRGLRGELLARRPTPEELFTARAQDGDIIRGLPFVGETAQALQKGIPYPIAFAAAMDHAGPWEEEELACQRRLGAVVGQLPLEEQLDALGLLVDTLSGYRDQAKSQLRDQCRMYRSLGVAVGAAVIILLI